VAVVSAIASLSGVSAFVMPGGPEWAGRATTLGPSRAASDPRGLDTRRYQACEGLAQTRGATGWRGHRHVVRRHLPPTVHLFGYGIPLGWLAYPLSMLWIVGVTNASTWSMDSTDCRPDSG